MPPYVTRQPLSAGGGPPDRPSPEPARDLTVDALVHVDPAPAAGEWRQRLLDRLRFIEHYGPLTPERRAMADLALVAYIDDPEIAAAFNRALG